MGSYTQGPGKRSDRIANDIKRWVIENDLSQGDKLPNEKQLADIFQCAKGTIREALKSLEVQGLITIRTGPAGGATLIEVSDKRTTELLRNFLQFRNLTVEQIYQLRKIIEVELAVSVTGLLSDQALTDLENQISGCCATPITRSNRDRHLRLREKELDFHEILATNCPNPLLAFHAHFLTDLLRNFIEFRFDHVSQYETFTKSNIDYHHQLVKAFRAKDRQQVETVMNAHMCDCESHTLSLNGTLSKDLMLNPY
jgi:DNA-binding FadR family transcriptional regulator